MWVQVCHDPDLECVTQRDPIKLHDWQNELSQDKWGRVFPNEIIKQYFNLDWSVQKQLILY